MNKPNLCAVLAAPLLMFAFASWSGADDAPAATTCKDGTTTAATGRGACSGHGGQVKPPKTSSTAASGAVPAAPLAPATPAGGSAPASDSPATTCKDGTTTAAKGRGACSGHGGQVKAPKTPAAGSETSAAVPAAPLTPAAPAGNVPAGATGGATTCKDGTTTAASGRGACSGHGGQVKASKAPAGDATSPAVPAAPLTPAAPAGASAPPATSPTSGSASSSSPAATTAAKSSTAAASESAPTRAAGNTDPTGATAKCKDGTYSKSQHHEGSCSHHGGVAEWLTAAQ